MIAVKILDCALTLHPERDVIEGVVELDVDTAELLARGADVPRYLIVFARCGMRGCGLLADVWIDPLYARLTGASDEETALEVHPQIHVMLANWRVSRSSLRVRLERERYRQERLMEAEADAYEMGELAP